MGVAQIWMQILFKVAQFWMPSNSVSASIEKNQLNPLSINQTEKLLDPLSTLR